MKGVKGGRLKNGFSSRAKLVWREERLCEGIPMNESGTEGVVALRSLQLFLYFGVFRGKKKGTEMHV